MFEGTGIAPVQMDVSMRRVQFARATRASRRSAATAITCRLPTGSFSTVLLIAMLEHTSEPWRVLAEARRVLKPGGRAIIVVPNDVTMSAGRLVLGKFPIRYPDHLTFTTPGRMHRWLTDGFRVTEEFPLPFRPLPYAVNLYYFMVAEAA